MKAITNTVLVMPDHYIPNATIILKDGRIIDFGVDIPLSYCDEIIDAEGNFVGPGLIDIHTHAGGDSYFYDDPVKASQFLLCHGVTDVLPALYFNMSKGEYISSIHKIDEAKSAGLCPNIAGYYMEGPYLNPEFGCDRDNNHWKGSIKKEDYSEILEAVKDSAKIWCVAPERENIEDFVCDVSKEIPSIIFSVAHSKASPQQIETLIPYGLCLATHHTNATGNLEKYPECRGVCVDETVNYHDDIYAELICDSKGIHVDPYMLRLIEKIKGKSKIILISDACVFNGPPIAGCEDAKDINFDFNGEIAGSKLTLDIACQNMMVHTGCSVCDVFKYASLNPAKLLKISDKGQIKKGNIANLVLVDNWFNVKTVIFNGERVFQQK